MYNNQRMCVAAGSIAGMSVAAYVVYRYITANGFCTNNSAEVKTSRPARIKVSIPKTYVGSIIGCGGGSIRAIEQDTDTQIIVKNELETEELKVLEIRGSPENAQLAETMILKSIQSKSEIETQDLFIPPDACGKIIGKNGQTIRIISTSSKAKIKVDSEAVNEQGQHKVAITGTQEQIQNAKSMIFESMLHKTKFTESSDASQKCNKYVCDLLGLREGFVEVFVSAMENPSHFWIQVVGRKSLDLDNLVLKMTKYYTEPDNCMYHELKEVLVGQLVAAPYGRDEKWYRAKVMEVSENENVMLFYLDYGDTATAARNNVFSLDAQFLKLHFQAIECKLSSVIPISEYWSDPAKEFFRSICQVAQWKTLEATIVNLLNLKFEKNREIVLAVELYVRENGRHINVSEKMVRKGFAKLR